MRNLIITLFLGACCYAPAGEIHDAYFKKVEANPEEWMKSRMRARTNISATVTNHGVTQIGIEHTGCFGTCPAYTLVISNSGTFRYRGEKYVERKGDFTGRIPTGDVDRLAQFIKDSGYMGLEDTYDRGVTDHSTVFTMVVMNGKQKVISDYAAAGPPKLWAIERLIDDLLTEAQWDDSTKAAVEKKP